MSMATDLAALVRESMSELDKRSAQLGAYKDELWKVSSQLEATLAGRTRQEEREMQSQLHRTLQQVDDTLAQIQRSKEMLQRVLMHI